MANGKLKTAVIAVHGVGHHGAGESAQAMVDLLHMLPRGPGAQAVGFAGGANLYSEFYGDEVAIPLQPVQALPLGAPAPGKMEFARERSQELATQLAAPGAPDAGLEFMRLTLGGYRGGADGNSFCTVRLRGHRNNGPGTAPTTVDIFEMRWADLASATNSVTSFFQALFQLLLHLASLSQLALDSGAGASPGSSWSRFRRFQSWAVRLLQLPIPFLTLTLLLAALAPLMGGWPAQQPFLAAAVAGLLALALLLIARLSWAKLQAPLWLLAPALAGAGGYWIGLRPRNSQPWLAGLEWWLLGAVLFWWVLRSYDRVRNGSFQVGWFTFAAAAFGFEMRCLLSATLEAAALQSVWALGILLHLAWGALIACALLALATGIVACRRAPAPQRPAAVAALWTSVLALALPALLFSFLADLLWSGLLVWGPFARLYSCRPVPSQISGWARTLHAGGWWGRFIYQPGEALAGEFLKNFLAWSLGAGFAYTVMVAGVAFLLLVCGLLPSIRSERIPPRTAPAPPPRGSTPAETAAFGRWLTAWLHSIRWVSAGLWLAGFVVPFFFWWASSPAPQRSTLALIAASGGLAASALVLGLAVRYGSGALSIMLDVDNYLRTTPAEAPPRALINERYVSLLRHLSTQGYDRVVIVAHSLGALITVDLLRYLHANPDPGNVIGAPGGVPVRLFTMGNPLCQLLRRFFPYLYDWAQPPTAAALGLAAWMNAYRGGDYVGRNLGLPAPNEICIGAGAHMHYWDDSAPQIAAQLNLLI